MADSKAQQAIGLDFGTSTSLVAGSDGIVSLGPLHAWLPSVAAYDGKLTVGEEVLALDTERIIRSVKRNITGDHRDVRVSTADGVRDIPADDVIVEILHEVIRRAEAENHHLSKNDKVRFGCPAMWDRKQRTRLLAIAEKAGLTVGFENLIDEPVAAGIAWLAGNPVLDDGLGLPKLIVVFDMGGGTLDIAVLEARGIGYQEISVLAALGMPEAGDALDEGIADDLENLLASTGFKIDELDSPERARNRLLFAAQEAKVGLTATKEHVVDLPKRIFGTSELWYRREQLEEVFTPQLERAEYYVAAALRAAKLTEAAHGSAYDIHRTPITKLAENVDYVVLSGGMSRIPLVAQRMGALFPKATVALATSKPEEAVVLGLAAARRHGRINMFRPGFDIYVSWDGGDQQRSIYEAFTPLYESWQVVQGGSQLGYTRNGLDLDLPRKPTPGRLRVVSHSGVRSRVALNDQNLDGFPVMLSDQKFEFFMQSNGRIRLTDAKGTFEGRVEDWHHQP